MSQVRNDHERACFECRSLRRRDEGETTNDDGYILLSYVTT